MTSTPPPAGKSSISSLRFQLSMLWWIGLKRTSPWSIFDLPRAPAGSSSRIILTPSSLRPVIPTTGASSPLCRRHAFLSLWKKSSVAQPSSGLWRMPGLPTAIWMISVPGTVTPSESRRSSTKSNMPLRRRWISTSMIFWRMPAQSPEPT